MEFPYTIENQQELDDLFKGRVAKERRKWEAERGADPDELSEAQARVDELEGEIRTRDARAVLSEMDVRDEKRQDRIIRLADLPEDADRAGMVSAFKDVYSDMPEVFGENAKVKQTALDTSRQSANPDSPITSREQIDANENAEPGWINRNWGRVSEFLSKQN